jgi:small conductance mechanosensitive channel
VLLVAIVAMLLLRFARRGIPRAVRRIGDVGRPDARQEQRAQTLSGLLVSVVTVVVWATVFFIVLSELDINLAPLIASAGVVGLAVGFGAQQVVRDVISGFFILVEDQFGVGDTVSAAGVTGTVENMSLRLTRLRADDGVLHHVRNGDLGVVSNSTRGWATARLDLPVPEGADPDQACHAVQAAMAKVVEDGNLDGLLLADPQVLGVTSYGLDGAVVSVIARAEPTAKAAVQRALLAAALGALTPDNRTKPRPRARRKP